jgi:hypothetical protein
MKRAQMKKSGVFKGLGIVVLTLAAGLILGSCDNPAGDDNDPAGKGGDPAGIAGGGTIVAGRYKTVPVSAMIASAKAVSLGRAVVEDSDDYVLASSGKDAKNTVHYYLYYLGYVESVPIAYKTAYYYNGTTPITITFEKSLVNEKTITESTTKTKENTTTTSTSATVGVSFGGEAGFLLFGKAHTNVNIAATVGGEWASTISTSNTLETAETKAEGVTETIEATIGEHGEAPGNYRYALFGVTDVYVLYAVDPASREIREATFTTCARESSYAWGIDFEPGSKNFGKTGDGDLLDIPDIDFSAVDAPVETVTDLKPPEDIPATKPRTIPVSTDEVKGNATIVSGDGDVDSKSGQKTDWEFEVKTLTLKNLRTSGANKGTYGMLEIGISYTVKEKKGDYTTLTLEHTQTVSLTNYKVIEMISTPQKITGSITGQNHTWVTVNTDNDLIGSLRLIIDSKGKDVDNIAFAADLNIEFLENNLL